LALVSAPGFASLSRFEKRERLRVQAAQAPIDASELEALDAVDVALKSQLLDWLERAVSGVSPAQ
jgi:hypothetical protein